MKHALTRLAALLVFVGLTVAVLLLVVAPAMRAVRGPQLPPAPTVASYDCRTAREMLAMSHSQPDLDNREWYISRWEQKVIDHC